MKKWLLLLSGFLLVGALSGCAHTVEKTPVDLPEIAEETDEFIPEAPTELQMVVAKTRNGESFILDGFSEMDTISSPLKLSGTVPTNWVFEGVFPITIMTIGGDIVKERYGEANIFDENNEIILPVVPFTAEIEFENPVLDGDETGKIRFAQDMVIGEQTEETREMIEVQVLFE